MIKISVKRKDHNIGSGFIALACGFKSNIEANVEGKSINAKSIMNSSIIDNAMEVEFTITGEDEDLAATAIKDFYKKR